MRGGRSRAPRTTGRPPPCPVPPFASARWPRGINGPDTCLSSPGRVWPRQFGACVSNEGGSGRHVRRTAAPAATRSTSRALCLLVSISLATHAVLAPRMRTLNTGQTRRTDTRLSASSPRPRKPGAGTLHRCSSVPRHRTPKLAFASNAASRDRKGRRRVIRPNWRALGLIFRVM